MPISIRQLNKFRALNEHLAPGDEISFPDGYRLVPEVEAKSIGATWGRLYVQIAPDGSSAS